MAPVYLTLCLSLFLTASQAVEYSVCPEDCECTENEEISNVKGFQLIDVDCKDEGLTSIPDLASLKNVTIHRLYLNKNRISSIPDKKAFKGLKITGIELTDNPLSHISHDAFTELKYCLEYLSMHRVPIKQRPSHFLNGLTLLRTLDLTGVTSPHLATMTNSTFGTLRMLETLVLKDCGISIIEENAFVGVQSILDLRLDNNRLTSVPDRSLRHLMELRTLNLDLNRITEIPRNSFITLINLRKLSMSDNELSDVKKIESEAFRGIGHNLMELDLSFNKMKKLPDHTFANLFNLGTLKVSDNEITYLENRTFDKLRYLLTLDLSGNSVEIKVGNFRGLEMSLMNLHLARTAITSETIPTDELRRLRYLTYLDLSRNDLKKLTNESLSGITAKQIRMSHCGIVDIESDTFSHLQPPLDVDLNHNSIETVTFLTDACLFQKLNLNHNPIDCDCDFLTVVSNQSTKFVGKCHSPQEIGDEDITMASKNSDIMELCKLDNQTEPVKCDWMVSGTTSISSGLVLSALSIIFSILCTIGK